MLSSGIATKRGRNSGVNRKTIAVMIALLLCTIITRLLVSQYLFLQEAESSIGIDRVKAYERVILHYVPLSPWTGRAVKELQKLCSDFYDEEEALYCYETLRSSLLQIRSVFIPYRDVLEVIIPRIAVLRAKLQIGHPGGESPYDEQTLIEYHTSLLRHDNSPSLFWSCVIVMSLLGWVGMGFALTWCCFREDKNKFRRLLFGGIAWLILFGIWILGLYRA